MGETILTVLNLIISGAVAFLIYNVSSRFGEFQGSFTQFRDAVLFRLDRLDNDVDDHEDRIRPLERRPYNPRKAKSK